MKNFTEWSKGDQPTGLEGIKRRLTEAYREFGDAAQRRPQRKPQPKPQATPEPKTDEFAGFAGMDPDKLDALKGLADKQLNPGARAQFVQNALANFQKQQAKPAEEPTPTQAPAPEKKLSLTPNTILSGGGTKPPTKPPVAAGGSKPESEPDDGTGGKLDSLISQIQGKGSVGPKVVGRIKEVLSSIKNPNARVRQVLERLGDERSGFLENVIDEYVQLYSPENIQKFKESNSFTDPESVLDFMKTQLGMVEDKKGRLGYGPMSPARAVALGQAPVAGMKFREYFGRQFHDRMGDGDFSHMDGVLGGTTGDIDYDGRRRFHQKTLKNDISTQMVREVFSRLHPAIQKELIGLGQPDPSSTGVFSPEGDWEMNFHNDNGVISGDTDFDLKQLSDDPEEREEWQNSITRSNPNENRGIMMLQKILANGFVDEVTGMPFMGGFKNLTADHIDGRKKASGENPTQDEPNNLAIIGKNINQMKSGISSQYGDDSFNKLMNGGFQEDGIFDRLFGNDEEGVEMEDSNKFASWAAERLLGSHFDERILKVLKNKADDDGDGKVSNEEKMDFISDIKDLLDMDNETLGQYMRDGGRGGVGLDLANLTKVVPRKSNQGDQNISKNTWRGGPGNSYNGTQFLDGFRKSMLARILTDTDLRTKIQSTQSEMERKGKKPEDISEAIRKIRKEWAKVNLKTPMQGHSSLFGLGRMNNEDFVNWFREQGTQNLESIKESHPEIYEGLMSQLGDLDGWLPILKKYVGGDAPFEFAQNDPRVLSAIHDEWGKQLMRSQFSRNQLSQEEIEAFYKNVTGREDFTDPIGESWLNPDTDLL